MNRARFAEPLFECRVLNGSKSNGVIEFQLSISILQNILPSQSCGIFQNEIVKPLKVITTCISQQGALYFAQRCMYPAAEA
jgi:hypothetical protein